MRRLQQRRALRRRVGEGSRRSCSAVFALSFAAEVKLLQGAEGQSQSRRRIGLRGQTPHLVLHSGNRDIGPFFCRISS
jgi:hypothetical protein